MAEQERSRTPGRNPEVLRAELARTRARMSETIDEIDLETTPLLPYVIAGELDLIDGMACDRAVEKAREEMDAVTTSALGRGEGGAGGNDGDGGHGGAPEPPTPPRLRVAATVLAQICTLVFYLILAWTGYAVLEILASDTLVSLPAVSVAYAQSVIPVSAVLIIIAQLLVFPEVLREPRRGDIEKAEELI